MRNVTNMNHGNHDARTGDESIGQDFFVIFSWNLQVFFVNFGNLMGFLPSWIFAGGAGRAIKSRFER